MNLGHFHLVVALGLVSMTLDAGALYKCVQAGGAVEFQQVPCGRSASQEKLELRTTTPAVVDRERVVRDQALAERRLLLRQAINEGRPIVGMTSRELEQAMGRPDKINAAQYGVSSQDQLVY